jgi:hypothetical protein
MARKLREVAEREGVSINQVNSSAAAKNASRRKFEAVLAKIPDVEPHKSDRLPEAQRRTHRKKVG